jgi:hypothetical protein
MRGIVRRRLALGILLALPSLAAVARAQTPHCIPVDSLGDFRWERQGFHDAANIRTEFWNFGMVGNYPRDPINVDLSTFHSAEVPKGSGMNYSDGITPFVLAKVHPEGRDVYIMETGFRERQAISGSHPGELQMRFEPRRGYFQEDPGINQALSPAISSDPRTWPAQWPDKAGDPADPGWKKSWNGYFGKRPAADQESYFVMDDDYYDSFGFNPDSLCPTRYGLGLRVEARGFQWANPQAGNVIFWHYDITNEGTTDYDNDIVFGLYMDSGVGGSANSCDGIAESDDDNAFFDKSLGLNLVYTWDNCGHGVDLAGNCSPTGYLGYAYLETPGNPYDGKDNDGDGIIDERRDSGPGERIVGQDAIRAYLLAHPEKYDLAAFQRFYGPLEQRPAYKVGVWWTGDEDMDWVAEFDDTGRDGVFGSADPAADGERDGIPTDGEPHFDKTDVDESDQIGLTGFKMNRIKAGTESNCGPGNSGGQIDDIVFFQNQFAWPERLYGQFTNPDSAQRFDQALVLNYNIGFLFASGPFKLPPGQHERFSLALAFGSDLAELRDNVHVVQQIYNANYQFAVPPPRPTLQAEAGDGYVRLSWDEVAERGFDPVSGLNDFEGYRIYRSTDPEFRDPRVLTSGRGTPLPSNGKPIAQFDLVDGIRGYSRTAVNGVQYWLGTETGITHTWTDSTVTNGQAYYYAVCSYDYGSPPAVPDSLAFYPSENSIPVSRNRRGELNPVSNVVAVRPEPHVPGFVTATTEGLTRLGGAGMGSVRVEIVNADSVPDGHLLKIAFVAPSPDSIRAQSYVLIDSTTGDTLIGRGLDFEGAGSGPIAAGTLPIIRTAPGVLVDESLSGFHPGASTDLVLQPKYEGSRSGNLRRPGYPADIRIVFFDHVVDTSKQIRPLPATPAKFKVYAKTDTGYRQIDFAFYDYSDDTTLVDSTLAHPGDIMYALDYASQPPTANNYTWHFFVDRIPQHPPSAGDTFDLHLTVPFGPPDAFLFRTRGSHVDAALAASSGQKPYVVPNPYVGSNSLEPARFAVSGRGERRMEFRAVPKGGVIRIYTVHGDLVRTLEQNGSDVGFVPWDLRTRDNLDVAAGLYVFQVSGPGVSDYVGKLAIIK